MTSEEILELIETLDTVGEKSIQEDFLYMLFESKLFQYCVKYAYEPLKTFNIKDTSRFMNLNTGSKEIGRKAFEVLDALAERKLTGNKALDRVESLLKTFNESSQKLFIRILNKKLIYGIGIKTINKVKPNFIKTVGFMRCAPFNPDWNWSEGVIAQEKMDGMFMNITAINDQTILTSRTGQLFDIHAFQMIDFDLLEKGYQYHGEMIIFQDGAPLDRKTSNGIANHILNGGTFKNSQRPEFYLWDKVPIEVITGDAKCPPYKVRVKELKNSIITPFNLVKTKVLYDLETIKRFCDSIISKGGEGLILKKFDALWKNGTSQDQIKMKPMKEADLRCVGLNRGTGKNEDTFGSMCCMSDDEKVKVNVSGFTDEERKEISDNFGKNWFGHIITINYEKVVDNKNSKYASLTLPTFIERRQDKETTNKLEEL